ncbi:MAG: nucleotidyltransferase [Clostridia bacterium]|nr:nucleotidyltransferase [Clostridia bacterium]
MSSVLGIVSEYNPFHNGHLHHLIESKKAVGADYSVAIMTGNFTQRGEPSLIDKWSKTRMAIESGIDLVIELPTIYAISSAENFSSGAIKILDSLDIVDFISFGSECNDISVLSEIANVLSDEPDDYKTLLNHELQKGESFAKAREKALMMYLNDVRRFANVLSYPNNILGIEYLKALNKQKSFIKPITIKRTAANHNDTIPSKHSKFASGSAIRNLCYANDIESMQNFMPQKTYDILNLNIRKGNIVNGLSAFDKEIIYTLRKMSTLEIANLPDVSEGLEHALKSAANECNSVIELLSLVGTKRYAKTRLQRILLYALLGITKKDMAMSTGVKPYVRVLGFNSKGRDMLSEISKRNPRLELVSSVKKFMDYTPNRNLALMMEKDIWATNVYTLGYEYESKANLDFTHKIITY